MFLKPSIYQWFANAVLDWFFIVFTLFLMVKLRGCFMFLRNLFCVLCCLMVVSCASKKSTEFTNYDEDLITPQTVDELILIDKVVHENPFLGVSLTYENRDFPEDNINAYVYAINEISWEDIDATLEDELNHALKEVDLAIQYGHYKSRETELITNMEFSSNQIKFSGKKASFKLTTKDNILIYSDIYLFNAEDKYIKFRTSFDSRMTNSSMGDSVVKKILPLMKIPPESLSMRALRDEQVHKLTELLQQLIQGETE